MSENYAVTALSLKARAYHLKLSSIFWRRIKIKDNHLIIKDLNKPLKIIDNGSCLLDTIHLNDGITLIDGYYWNEETKCYEKYSNETITTINEGIKEEILDGDLVESDCLYDSFSQQQVEQIFSQFKALRQEYRSSQKAL